MNDNYYLKIGGNELIRDEEIVNLASDDPSLKKKAETNVSTRLKETRVRVGTLLKTDNVSFLIGAGASMASGGVGLASIPVDLEKQLHRAYEESNSGKNKSPEWLSLFYRTISILTREDFRFEDRPTALKNDQAKAITINLEEYLTRLQTWRAAVTDSTSQLTLVLDSGTLVLNKIHVDQLILELDRALTSLCDLPLPETIEPLKHHRRFIKKTLTRPLNLRRANLFTLNYDTLLEQAADAEGAVLVDGFVGTLRRVFRPESYDLDFYFPAQTTEGRVHRFDRALHLYKLHGSITWHRTTEDWQNPYGLFATFFDETRADDDVLIYPTPLKYGQTLGLPYSELFRRFSSSIAQPQSVLFTIGYGFGDDHVNSLIRQALAIPSFTLVIVDPAPSSQFVKKLKDANDERVWIVGGWELGTFENFVDKLLPDLREEEITANVMKTYGSLQSVPTNPRNENGES